MKLTSSETLYAESAPEIAFRAARGGLTGRLSRHEFAAILPSVSGAGLAILAANRILRAFEEPFEVGGRPALVARLAIGISGYPEHGQRGAIASRRIARSEAQLAQEPYAVYDRKKLHRQDRMKRSLEALLRHALHENELEIYLQPQVDIASGQWSVPSVATLASGRRYRRSAAANRRHR